MPPPNSTGTDQTGPRLGSLDRAVELRQPALVLYREVGIRPHEAQDWSCLADVGAVAGYCRAGGLFPALGDPCAEADTLRRAVSAQADPADSSVDWSMT
mgnify:CR=1 FL=1